MGHSLTTVGRALIAADSKMTARRFSVRIGERDAPRLTLDVMAPTAFTAHDQHADLALPGERIEVLPAGDLTPGDLAEIDRQFGIGPNVDAMRRAGWI